MLTIVSTNELCCLHEMWSWIVYICTSPEGGFLESAPSLKCLLMHLDLRLKHVQISSVPNLTSFHFCGALVNPLMFTDYYNNGISVNPPLSQVSLDFFGLEKPEGEDHMVPFFNIHSFQQLLACISQVNSLGLYMSGEVSTYIFHTNYFN